LRCTRGKTDTWEVSAAGSHCVGGAHGEGAGSALGGGQGGAGAWEVLFPTTADVCHDGAEPFLGRHGRENRFQPYHLHEVGHTAELDLGKGAEGHHSVRGTGGRTHPHEHKPLRNSRR
jgi:hypothetical protein